METSHAVVRPLPAHPTVTLVYQGPLDVSLVGVEGIWIWDHGYWRERLHDCGHRAPWRPHPQDPRSRYCTGCGIIIPKESHGYS